MENPSPVIAYKVCGRKDEKQLLLKEENFQTNHHSTNQWKHGPPIAACSQQPRSDNRCYTTRWQRLFRSLSKVLFAVSSGHFILHKIVVNFIKSNSRLLGGLCNSSLEDHCKRMEKPGTFGTQAELQAASSLLQDPLHIFQKPNELRDWE